MQQSGVKIYSYATAGKRLRKRAARMELTTFPRFVTEVDDVCMLNWDYLFRSMRDHCFVLVEESDLSQPVAVAFSWPFVYPKDGVLSHHGIAWLLSLGVQCHEHGWEPDFLGVGGISVHKEHRHKGHASALLRHLKERAKSLGLGGLLISVRPTCKVFYPSVPQSEYMHWQRGSDGQLFDPWLRLHVRAGGKLIATAKWSNVTMHGLKAFQRWTGRKFSCTGWYFVKGAVSAVWVNKEEGCVMYIEEDVWITHDLQSI